MPRRRQRKCRHCGHLYEPDTRNDYHQRYCSQPACRQASRAASRARWRASAKGCDYFRGSANVLRVQAWRKAHPGYWRKGTKRSGALQDHCPPQALVPPADKGTLTLGALQDVCLVQGLVLQGLIAQLTGSALQESIVPATHRLILLGQQIQGPGSRRQVHGRDQTSVVPPAVAEGAGAVQLDRPSPGS